VTQAMAPLLKTAAGRVINISSLLALPAQMSQLPGQFFGYRIAKAALNAVTAGLAEELRPQGVSVNAVHPGWLKTSMGGPHAPEEATAGADRVVDAILSVPHEVTGKLLVDRSLFPSLPADRADQMLMGGVHLWTVAQ